jgi:hypothetical protein
MNSDIKKIIGKYLLPSFEDVKRKKSDMLGDLLLYIINIKFYLNNNLISPDGGDTKYDCNNFTNKKYKHEKFYWTIR